MAESEPLMTDDEMCAFLTAWDAELRAMQMAKRFLASYQARQQDDAALATRMADTQAAHEAKVAHYTQVETDAGAQLAAALTQMEADHRYAVQKLEATHAEAVAAARTRLENIELDIAARRREGEDAVAAREGTVAQLDGRIAHHRSEIEQLQATLDEMRRQKESEVNTYRAEVQSKLTAEQERFKASLEQLKAEWDREHQAAGAAHAAIMREQEVQQRQERKAAAEAQTRALQATREAEGKATATPKTPPAGEGGHRGTSGRRAD